MSDRRRVTRSTSRGAEESGIDSAVQFTASANTTRASSVINMIAPTARAVEQNVPENAVQRVPDAAATSTALPAANLGAVGQRENVPTSRSVRSGSTSATLIRQAEYEAQRQLTELSKKQLQLEADLIKKKLALEISEIEQRSDQGSCIEPVTKVENWLQDQAEPQNTHIRTDIRGETGERIIRRDVGRSACIGATPGRPRSPSATRNRSQGRNVDRLAEALEKMMHRKPSRQTQDLPAFTGNTNEWLPFKAAYEDSTKLYRFTPMENLARLRCCVKGEAKETVAALMYTASDPEVIMQTLERCYGRPETLIGKALENLKSLPKVNTTGELNIFAIKVQNIVSMLTTIDNRGYLLNPMLAQEVAEKLPPHLLSKWCDYASNINYTEPEIISMMKFLNIEADKVVRYIQPTTSSSQTQKRAGFKNPAQTKGTCYSVATEKGTECLCCKVNGHQTSQCQKFIKMSTDDKWKFVKINKICFKCINKKHRRMECKASLCGVEGCERPHHALLHQRRTDAAASAPPEKEGEPERDASVTALDAVVSAVAWRAPRRVLLKMCEVTLLGATGEVTAYALLDEGSTVSLVDDDLAAKVGANGPNVPLRIRGVNKVKDQLSSKMVGVRIRGAQEEHSFEIKLHTVSDLQLTKQTMPNDIERFEYLQDVCKVYSTVQPKILIGIDHWYLMSAKEHRRGRNSEPAAVRTDLGWVIFGRVPHSGCLEGHSVMHIDANIPDERLDEMIKHYFSLESVGISAAVKQTLEQARAIQIFESTVRRVDERMEVGLPWREDHPSMPPSYEGALRRLQTLERKMSRDPGFKAEYTGQVQNLFNNNYATKCNGTENKDGKEWYLPHFAVRNPNKPGRIRMVFDAAASSRESRGICLNQKLLEGPDLLRSLPGILFRFRERRVAITADIKEMFLQIKIRAEDQPAQMFLWREEETEPPEKFKMTSLIFGATCSPFIAHSVRDRNARDHATEYPRAAKAITESHYMDDLVDSYEDETEAAAAVREVRHVHAQASFTLRGWSSNRPRVLDAAGVPPDIRACAPTSLGSTMNAGGKILGLLWNAESDELGFNTAMNRVAAAVKNDERAPTKREALSAVMSIYDPLGFLSHFTIAAKIILQELWRHKIGWDDKIPNEEAQLFKSWLLALQEVNNLKIPRCYLEEHQPEKLELHIFCDASEQAYASTAFWRVTEHNRVRCIFIAAKAKVSPLKIQTIPRLELQAAVIGTRLAEHVIGQHRWQPERIVYWTDSQTVLHWIRKDAKKYTPYVAHRLAEIAEKTAESDWRWVPTSMNVADEATRVNINNLNSNRWFNGPEFLIHAEETWPSEEADSHMVPVDETVHTIIATKSWLPDIERFSSHEKLIRATAFSLLFIEKIKSKNRALQLEVVHLQRAQDLWLRRVQEECFAEEIEDLQKGHSLRRSSRIQKLDPVIETGLLKLNGRTRAAEIPDEAKRPVILDGRHPYVKLLILSFHRSAGHANNERVINDIRQRFWIIHLRPTVRAVAKGCQICRIRKAVPVAPVPGDLPSARVRTSRPFAHCGIDYFGPMTVKIGRRREKRWGALFTCLATRGVHLEVVSSLSTDSALMAMRRMAARRGWPTTAYSDNASNFRSADRELRAAQREWAPHLAEQALSNRTQWRFIPPGAPHMGGAWERLVRSVKVALAATLREKVVTDEVLQTLMTEAEHSINCRPLTHVSVDPADPEALTPNHFLIGRSNGLPHTGPCAEASRSTWRVSQALADTFWRRWVREYLPLLTPRGEAARPHRNLRRGDLVVVADPTLPRNVWPRGEVVNVFPGPDGIVRSADVRTRSGVFRRPVTKLAVLQIEKGCD